MDCVMYVEYRLVVFFLIFEYVRSTCGMRCWEEHAVLYCMYLKVLHSIHPSLD